MGHSRAGVLTLLEWLGDAASYGVLEKKTGS